MKHTIAMISALATLALAAPQAFAQDGDDDEDLFGDDTGEGGDEGFGEGGDETTGGDTGGSADATGDTAATAEASAGSGDHKLGIGFSTTVGGLQSFTNGGLEVEYWLSDSLAINALGRLGFFSPDIDMVDSTLLLQVGGGALLVVKDRGAAKLMVGGRFLLGFTSGDNGTTSIAIEAPVRLQMRLAPRLSAHVEGGVAIGIGDQQALTGGGGNDFELLIGTRNVFGQAGLTAYF